jgi:hypothetical protein
MEFSTHSPSNWAVINCAVKTEGKILPVWGPLNVQQNAGEQIFV